LLGNIDCIKKYTEISVKNIAVFFDCRQWLLPSSGLRNTFSKASLSGEQMLNVYSHLRGETDFLTLQAATSKWEDFAESFTTDVHVVLDKHLWQVMLESKGNIVTIIDSCWQEVVFKCTPVSHNLLSQLVGF